MVRWKAGEESRTGASYRPSLLQHCFSVKLSCLTELSKDCGNAANKMDLEFIYFPSLKSVMVNVYITGALLSLFAFRIRLQSVRWSTCVNEHGSKIRIGFVSYVSGLALLIDSFFNRCIKWGHRCPNVTPSTLSLSQTMTTLPMELFIIAFSWLL